MLDLEALNEKFKMDKNFLIREESIFKGDNSRILSAVMAKACVMNDAIEAV